MSGEQLSASESQELYEQEAAFWAQPEVQEQVAEFRAEVAAGTVVHTDMTELRRILVPESS